MPASRVEAESPPRPSPQADPGGVLVDVLGDHGQDVVPLDDAGGEPTLEQVADAVVAPVEAHRVETVQPLHPLGQRGSSCLDEKVEVVVEDDPDPDPPAVPPRDADEELLPFAAVEVVEEDLPLLDAAADDVVVRRARELRARNPGHRATVPAPPLGRNRPESAIREGQSLGRVPGTVPWTVPVRPARPLSAADCA